MTCGSHLQAFLETNIGRSNQHSTLLRSLSSCPKQRIRVVVALNVLQTSLEYICLCRLLDSYFYDWLYSLR